MEYTQEMYKEDLRISKYTFIKNFRKYTDYEEEMIQSSLLALSKARDYVDESKGKYSTLAFVASKRAMLHFLRQKSKEIENKTISLSTPIGENINLGDTLEEEVDFNSSMNCAYLLDICERAIQSQRNKTMKKFVYDYLDGLNMSKIARKYNVSKQFVSQLITKFRRLAKNIYIQENAI